MRDRLYGLKRCRKNGSSGSASFSIEISFCGYTGKKEQRQRGSVCIVRGNEAGAACFGMGKVRFKKMAIWSFTNLKKTWYYLKKNGIQAAILAIAERLSESGKPPYAYRSVPEEALREQRCRPPSAVRFSVVVPAFETREAHWTALLDSLAAQSYENWELVIADASQSDRVEKTTARWREAHRGADGRELAVRYVRLSRNGGIAENTNAAIACAAGDYIGLLDHDDLLTPDALYEMAKAIEEEKKAGKRPQVLYSDEDKCDDWAAAFYEPHFKKAFDPELLLSNNYICHFLVMESALMKALKLRPKFEGAQDYDLVLRAAGGGAHFVHVGRVLYHWRCHSGSTAANPKSKGYAYDAGRRAVEDFCRTAGWRVRVSPLKHLGFYRVDYEGDIFGQRPEVGALSGALPDRKRLVSGIYDETGTMLYEGLRKGFSGPMHRAALQQEAVWADLRGMRVREELASAYQEALGRIAGVEEGKIRQESRAFCDWLRAQGYRIVWDPQAKARDVSILGKG